jgi:hypothetical protein
VSKAKPGLSSISANLSYAHDRDVIARSVLQQRELKRLTSAGLAFHENAQLNFVLADFANPALG